MFEEVQQSVRNKNELQRLGIQALPSSSLSHIFRSATTSLRETRRLAVRLLVVEALGKLNLNLASQAFARCLGSLHLADLRTLNDVGVT